MRPEEPAKDARSREPARRLFFALWPDETMRQAMAHAVCNSARVSGGRPVPATNLHVTLAFLGSVPERRLAEVAEIARAAAPTPALTRAGVSGSLPRAAGESAELPEGQLALTFDHLEHWRAAQLLCALPAESPAAIADLARRLQHRLAASGSAPFRPHVTLARKVHRTPRMMEMQPITWSFTDFVLVDSKTLPTGSVYTVVERFPFA